jgi:hypothetical protein
VFIYAFGCTSWRKRSLEPVRCTRLLGVVALGFKHLKKPSIWWALKQTSKRLLQPWRDYGVGCVGIFLRFPHAKRTIFAARLISEDEQMPEPLLVSIEGIELIYQSLDGRVLPWPYFEDDQTRIHQPILPKPASGWTAAPSRCSDTLPDEVATLLDAPQQHRARTHGQSIPRNFDQAFLVDTDPVGKQAELHVMDDRVSVELVPAAIGHVGLGGVRLLFCTRPEKISSSELLAVMTHHGYEHVSVLAVRDVPNSILTERVGDPAIEAPVLPGYESPCANERVRRHRLLPQVQSVRFMSLPAIEGYVAPSRL